MDEHREALEGMAEDKNDRRDAQPVKAVNAKLPSNVIDLVTVLQESLAASKLRHSSSSSSSQAEPAADSKVKKPARQTKSRRETA